MRRGRPETWLKLGVFNFLDEFSLFHVKMIFGLFAPKMDSYESKTHSKREKTTGDRIRRILGGMGGSTNSWSPPFDEDNAFLESKRGGRSLQGK